MASVKLIQTSGTGIIAEAAVILLVVSVWATVFINQPLILFSVHPLANSFGMLALIQSILVLQPTRTPEQKEAGQKIHAGLNLLAILSFVTGSVAIQVNKFKNGLEHFKSPHSIIGIVVMVWYIGQYMVGVTMLNAPHLYGGEAKAKAIWKVHRLSGYVLLLLLLASFTSATKTDYNENALGLKTWAMVLTAFLLIIGVYPRIKMSKLGF